VHYGDEGSHWTVVPSKKEKEEKEEEEENKELRRIRM